MLRQGKKTAQSAALLEKYFFALTDYNRLKARPPFPNNGMMRGSQICHGFGSNALLFVKRSRQN